MKRILAIACVAALAAGCATVGQVKALEARVNSLEKKVAQAQGSAEATAEKAGNLESRIATLESNYKILYDKVNELSKSAGAGDVPKVKNVK
ncbi:MAG: hypothetical protein ABIM88_07215 [candidate division WOR-3 bacterium]